MYVCACVHALHSMNLHPTDSNSSCNQLYYCQLKEVAFAGSRRRKSVASYLRKRKLVCGGVYAIFLYVQLAFMTCTLNGTFMLYILCFIPWTCIGWSGFNRSVWKSVLFTNMLTYPSLWTYFEFREIPFSHPCDLRSDWLFL